MEELIEKILGQPQGNFVDEIGNDIPLHVMESDSGAFQVIKRSNVERRAKEIEDRIKVTLRKFLTYDGDALESIEKWWQDAQERMGSMIVDPTANPKPLDPFPEVLARAEARVAVAIEQAAYECCAKEKYELRKHRDKLENVLQELVDWQNGPPLITYTDGWTKTMEKAAELLEKNK